MRKYLTTLVWTLPFISFFFGYQIVRLFVYKEVFVAPEVLGQHIQDAIKVLSESKLNVRILAEKEDADLPEGIIISQSPNPGQSVKSHQSIFLVITRKPAKPVAPNLYGLSNQEAQNRAKNKNIHLKSYSLPSDNPIDTVIAQSDLPQQEVSDNAMMVYLSRGPSDMRIFPNLKGKLSQEVVDFFKTYNIQVQVLSMEQGATHDVNSIVIDQRPMPGTLIDLKKSFIVQITVDQKGVTPHDLNTVAS